jgi:hypothetical protein
VKSTNYDALHSAVFFSLLHFITVNSNLSSAPNRMAHIWVVDGGDSSQTASNMVYRISIFIHLARDGHAE